MKSDEHKWNPPFNAGHRTIRLASPLFCYLPLVVKERHGQVLFEFVNQLELHGVQVAVGLDDLVPE